MLDLLDQFSDIFAKDSTNYGLAKGLFIKLILVMPPFQAEPYCCSQVEDTQVSKELKQLLDVWLLAPSQSPWASPFHILKKKDGGHHIVMDY